MVNGDLTVSRRAVRLTVKLRVERLILLEDVVDGSQ